LAKGHGIDLSKETVRGWMVSAGLWKAQSRKLGEAHFWRPRRSGYGELVQWDTSNHDWLEGRGEVVRYLVKWIDDATSRGGRSAHSKPELSTLLESGTFYFALTPARIGTPRIGCRGSEGQGGCCFRKVSEQDWLFRNRLD
jgi:hypothetical protein